MADRSLHFKLLTHIRPSDFLSKLVRVNSQGWLENWVSVCLINARKTLKSPNVCIAVREKNGTLSFYTKTKQALHRKYTPKTLDVHLPSIQFTIRTLPALR